jgi:hypothetical protein
MERKTPYLLRSPFIEVLYGKRAPLYTIWNNAERNSDGFISQAYLINFLLLKPAFARV